jgi:hypothetical protein
MKYLVQLSQAKISFLFFTKTENREEKQVLFGGLVPVGGIRYGGM